LQRTWRSISGDTELAEIIARILLGAFAVVFAFAIAFAIASSVAGQFSDAGTVVLAILGGFAFAIALTVAYVIAGIWALAVALVIVTILALTIAKQFAFFLLLFFIILPILNALMDWVSWAVTRFLLTWIHEAPDGLSGVAAVVTVLLMNVILALTFVVALAILLPIGLELVDLMLSIFGHNAFNWRTVATQALQDPWNEGLFVSGMLLTPLVPSIANMTLGLAALGAPHSPGASQAEQLIPEHPEASPSEAETKQIGSMVFWSRLWYVPSFFLALGVYVCIWTILYASDLPMAKFLHSLALCSTSWGQGTCPGF
jgi:MFS family permease